MIYGLQLILKYKFDRRRMSVFKGIKTYAKSGVDWNISINKAELNEI